MSLKEVGFAVSTVWVILAAILVIFMQAGFAFLEAGLTRMKNVGHIAAKNVLILAIASVVYYCVGFGMAFGDGGNGIVGGSGFFPSVDELLTIGESPFSWFSAIPGAAGLPVRGRLRRRLPRDRVGRDGRAHEALGLLRVRGVLHAHLLARLALDLEPATAGCSSRACRTSPARRSSTTRAPWQGSPERSCSARGSASSAPTMKPNAIPGHNMAFTTLGVIILWFGWFGFNPGSTLSVDFGGVGFFAYVALNTNLAAAAGVLGAVVTSWLVVKKPDLSMMLNGAIAALVAITAACAFVAPWAAIVIGFVSGIIVVVGSLLVERVGLDDPVGAIAAHGMSGVWGTLSLGFLAVPKLAEQPGDRERAASSTAAASTSSGRRRSVSPRSGRSRSPSRS